MINAVLIDDEGHCTDRLAKLLRENCAAEVSICGSFNNITDATTGIGALKPDLVFLDVMLHNTTGFDLLRQLPAINFEVIFTTGFDQFAVEAFRFSALDYLLKPIDPQELISAVAKLTKKSYFNTSQTQFETLLDNLKAVGQHKRLAIPTMQGIDFINLREIIRCQSEGNYTIIYLTDKQKITVSKTLKDFETLLSGYDFFRVHHSHIVNLAYVKSYFRGKTGHIVMTDDSKIELATRRKEEFMKKMLR